MEIFKINDKISIACEAKKTRNGFKHEAALLIDGSEMGRVKVNYLNRTWEQYTFQSAIHKLLEKLPYLSQEQRDMIKTYLDGADGCNGAGCERDMRGLGVIARVAQMGEILAPNSKNEWKKRMLKAGLGDNVQFPDGWDTLSEAEKEKRLNEAIAQLK